MRGQAYVFMEKDENLSNSYQQTLLSRSRADAYVRWLLIANQYIRTLSFPPSMRLVPFWYANSTVKTLNIGTPRPATVVVLNIKPFNFTMK